MKRLIVAFIILLAGCTAQQNQSNVKQLEQTMTKQQTTIEQLQKKNKQLQQENEQLKSQVNQVNSSSLLSVALDVVNALKNHDMNTLSSYVHSTAGVRFSPYSHIDVQHDLQFSASQLPSLWSSTQVYQWGAYDGSGDPIQLTFQDYFDRFVYDVDFANPHMIGNNVVVGTGNMINNIQQAYPNGSFVEFHFNGFDPQYNGMDWRSLRLVFEQESGQWKLVGIIHDEWTT
ncbi:cell division protein FtsB [Anoxybacillus mongoliensis]|uniref:Cell division protein FtsB n=1 Tax=Anoxybacillus mongoliensis TaxID=452565 RepID=A0A7W8JET4_9BACL|nr:cell division protein FtsB [Anoxybacillus mongoliensis]MCX8002022.1 tropomyosin [Anoxybacillus mongoliensis]